MAIPPEQAAPVPGRERGHDQAFPDRPADHAGGRDRPHLVHEPVVHG